MKTRRRNILLVANFRSDVGFAWWFMENFWAEIADHFHREGRKTILAYPEIGRIPDRIANSPIEVRKLSFADRSSQGLKRIQNLVRECDISSVYLTDSAKLDRLYRMLRRWSVDTIVNNDQVPGERLPPGRVKRAVKERLHRVGLWSCDLNIAASDFVLRRMVQCDCIPAEKCCVVRNGIEPIDRGVHSAALVQETFQLPRDALVVVTVGRAAAYKRIDFVIECAHVLCNKLQVPNVYFLHLGDGPQIDQFRSLADKYQLGKRFIFAGKRDDVRALLPSCHIALHASQGEAFSLAVLEYMSAGLATLVPNNCGNPEAIEHEKTGIVYRPGDLDEAVGWIARLAREETLRRALGQAAAESIQRDFDIRAANGRLISVLDGRL